MVAIVGLPGSRHHKWKWFPHGGRVDGETAQEWLDRKYDETLAGNPVLGNVDTQVVSDKVARAQRYQDGSRIYPID